jgi:predicted RNase H-like nuclease (RuvC/YqgF family)
LWEIKAKFDEALRLLEEQTRPKEKQGAPASADQRVDGEKASPQKRLSDLSSQVDKLLKEMESLRREMREHPPEKP